MKCTQCDGEIIVKQDMVQDMDQFGPQGGKRYMHHSSSDCSAARRNPSRRNPTKRRKKHASLGDRKYRVIFGGPGGKEIHHSVRMGDGTDIMPMQQLRVLAAYYIAAKSGMAFKKALSSIVPHPHTGEVFRRAGGSVDAEELEVSYVVFPRRSNGMDGRRHFVTFTFYPDPGSIEYDKQISILGAAEAVEYRKFPDYETAHVSILSVHDEPYTKSIGRERYEKNIAQGYPTFHATRRNPLPNDLRHTLKKTDILGYYKKATTDAFRRIVDKRQSTAVIVRAMVRDYDMSETKAAQLVKDVRKHAAMRKKQQKAALARAEQKGGEFRRQYREKKETLAQRQRKKRLGDREKYFDRFSREYPDLFAQRPYRKAWYQSFVKGESRSSVIQMMVQAGVSESEAREFLSSQRTIMDEDRRRAMSKARRKARSKNKTVTRRNPPARMNEKDLRRRNFKGKKLKGAQMWRSNLSGVDLSNANLSQAAIWESNLSGANLSEADLRNAQLNGSDLRNANLRHAKMFETNIDGADLSGADLRGTDLSDVMFSENARFMDAVYDENTEWPYNIDDPEMQVGARHQYTMVLNPQRRNNPSRRARNNPSTSAKLEALAKKHGTRTKAGKLAMAIAKDLKRQGGVVMARRRQLQRFWSQWWLHQR